MTLPIGYFGITSQQPELRVVALFGDAPPTISGGYGGWGTVARPKRLSLTEWNGSDPFQLELPFILDKFAAQTSVEDLVLNLEKMALVFPGYATPPLVDLEGPIPHTELTWVINAIAWGNKEINREGNIVRQFGTLSLMQFVPDELVTDKKKPSAAKPKWKWHTLKKGDTITTLAKKYCKKPVTKAKLAKFKSMLLKENKIRDPRRPFLKLKKVKVPLL